jgi:hypothetical protein
MDINKVLELAPSKIAEYTSKENLNYAIMITTHAEYKRLWAKYYLEKKLEYKKTIKELECELELMPELIELQNKEITAEIDYRSWREKKNKASDTFQAAMELGRTKRTELKTLHDSV